MDKYVTAKMNTAGGVEFGHFQVILLIVSGQAVIVVNNSKCFTYSSASCPDNHQPKLISKLTRIYICHCSVYLHVEYSHVIKGVCSACKFSFQQP